MKGVLTLTLCLAGHLLGLAQGTFRNLDFEEGYLPPVTTGYEPVADALPGWTVLHGSDVQTTIPRSHGVGGLSTLSIMETRIWPIFPDNYYVMFTRNALDLTPMSLHQTGLVPSETMSLRFAVAVTVWIPGDLQVELNGTPLSLEVLNGSGVSYTVGADASAFAGQTVELRLTSRPYVEGGVIQTFLDDIEFSPLPIPEPSAGSLFLLGLAIWCWRKRFGRVH